MSGLQTALTHEVSFSCRMFESKTLFFSVSYLIFFLFFLAGVYGHYLMISYETSGLNSLTVMRSKHSLSDAAGCLLKKHMPGQTFEELQRRRTFSILPLEGTVMWALPYWPTL